MSLALGPGGRLEKEQREGALAGGRSPGRREKPSQEEGPLNGGNECVTRPINGGLECQSKAFASQ